MKITFEKQGDIRILPVFSGEFPEGVSEEITKYLTDTKYFKAKLGETFANVAPGGENLILVGMGEREKLDYDALRTMAFRAMKTVEQLNIEQANFIIPEIPELADRHALGAILEGILQNDYRFDKYKSKKEDDRPDATLCLEAQWIPDKESILREVEGVMEGVKIARDLINEPPMVMTPEKLAQTAKEALEPVGVKVTVLDERAIADLGMVAFLSVARGSNNPPRFLRMEYMPEGDDKPALVLVGKGLTYDSGGYSIKPTDGMVTMKSDMAGSAAVIGAMYSIAKNKGKHNVIGIVAACENLISGNAYKPGDVIGSMSGKTIEVLNTDAEGRITLADALYYAATECNASGIIDVATLTGACVVALGNVFTGAVTNDETLLNTVHRASEMAGEPVWLLPSHDLYREMIKGDLGDLKNVGGRGAGAITAGLFLENFVEEKPWVHLDIAGTSYLDKAKGYLPKGATGVMVKTFYMMVR